MSNLEQLQDLIATLELLKTPLPPELDDELAELLKKYRENLLKTPTTKKE